MRHPSEPGWPPEDPPALDGDSAERLASGRTAPDDAPPGYEGVASLLHSLASAAGPEPKGEAETVAAMAAVLAHTTPTSLSSRRRQSMITKLVPAKVAAVAVGALLSTGAAAAAGALPDPVQSAVSDALGAVGLQVPDGSNSGTDPLDVLDETTTTTVDDGTTTTTIDDETTTTTIGDGTTTTTTPTGGGDGTGTDDACTSAANHGQFVSGVARATPRGPGHGAVVSDAAQSDCGRNGGDDDGGDDGDTTDTTVGSNTAGSNSGPGNSGNGNSGKGNSGNGNGNGGSGGRSGRG